MLCFPLDNTEYEAEGLGLEHVTRSRGVFAADDNLRVSAGGGMNVTISPGICFLKMGEYWGVTALQKTALSLPIQAADGTLTRKDAVVARIDKVANLAEIVVKPGTPASSPELPAIVRDDDYDEIYLASVTVVAGVVEITNGAGKTTALSPISGRRSGRTSPPTRRKRARLRKSSTQPCTRK